MSADLSCRQCGSPFTREAARGPEPSYCSQSCRQRAYESRAAVLSDNAAYVRGKQAAIDAVSGYRDALLAKFDRSDSTQMTLVLVAEEWLSGAIDAIRYVPSVAAL